LAAKAGSVIEAGEATQGKTTDYNQSIRPSLESPGWYPELDFASG